VTLASSSPLSSPASSSRASIVLAFTAIYLVWGSTYLAIRFALETLPPFLMVGVRFLMAGGILFTWAWLRGELRRKPHEVLQVTSPATGPRSPLSFVTWRAAFVAGGLLLLGGNGGVVWAEYLGLPSGLAALIVSTVPLWVVVLEWLGPRSVRTGRPGRPVAVGVLLGLAGVVLLLGPKGFAHSAEGAEGGALLLGGAIVVAASLSWAYGSVISRRLPLPSSPLLATAMEMLAGGVLLTLAGFATGEWGRVAWEQVSTKSLLALGYLVVFGSLVAFTAYVWLLKVVPTSKVATYAYVNPVVALFLGWGLAAEPLTARTLMAAAVILGAVVLITTFRRVPEKAPGKGSRIRPEGSAAARPSPPARPAPAEGGDCIWVAVPRPLVPRVQRLLAEESSEDTCGCAPIPVGLQEVRQEI